MGYSNSNTLIEHTTVNTLIWVQEIKVIDDVQIIDGSFVNQPPFLEAGLRDYHTVAMHMGAQTALATSFSVECRRHDTVRVK